MVETGKSRALLAAGFGKIPSAAARRAARRRWHRPSAILARVAPLIHVGGLAVMRRAAAVGFRQQLVVQPAKAATSSTATMMEAHAGDSYDAGVARCRIIARR